MLARFRSYIIEAADPRLSFSLQLLCASKMGRLTGCMGGGLIQWASDEILSQEGGTREGENDRKVGEDKKWGAS